MRKMNNMAKIRKQVFAKTQAEFAHIAGVSQGTVSRWERDELEPTLTELVRVRTWAVRRRLAWHDAMLFKSRTEARCVNRVPAV